MNKLFLAAVAMAALTQSASAACVLKREAMPDDPKCIGLVGYSGGARVGFFRWTGGRITVGGTCSSSLLKGSMAGSNKVNVSGGVRTLSDDCRSTL